jgi:hypothetical protein
VIEIIRKPGVWLAQRLRSQCAAVTKNHSAIEGTLASKDFGAKIHGKETGTDYHLTGH